MSSRRGDRKDSLSPYGPGAQWRLMTVAAIARMQHCSPVEHCLCQLSGEVRDSDMRLKGEDHAYSQHKLESGL